jgi:hypothetical protein
MKNLTKLVFICLLLFCFPLSAFGINWENPAGDVNFSGTVTASTISASAVGGAVESTTGSQSKVDTHSNLTTGMHGTTTLVLAGDCATGADVNPIDLTGMVFTYAANSKYVFDMYMLVQPTAATTGCGFQINLSSAVTQVALTFYHQLAGVTTGTLSGGYSIADDLSGGASSGMPGTTVIPVMGSGFLVTTGNTGTAQFRFRSEVAAVTTCKAGSMIIIRKVA